MSVTVAISSFEGPLGLLLEHVERGKMEVTAISVADITQNYLNRIKDLTSNDPDELSEFLQLGCRLIHIKSLALLPKTDHDNQPDELKQLNIELEEYRSYQVAAASLARNAHHRTWQRQSTTLLDPGDVPVPTVDLAKLQEAFSRALQRAEPMGTRGTITSHLTQAEVSAQVVARLKSGSYELDTLLSEAKDRLTIIVTFLAILELIKLRRIRVVQPVQFEPIMVEVFRV